MTAIRVKAQLDDDPAKNVFSFRRLAATEIVWLRVPCFFFSQNKSINHFGSAIYNSGNVYEAEFSRTFRNYSRNEIKSMSNIL